MAGKKSLESKFCMLRDSSKLRELLNHRKDCFGLTISKLSELTGIPAYRLGRYLSKGHWGNKPSITQYQLLTICEVLGVEVDISVKIVSDTISKKK